MATGDISGGGSSQGAVRRRRGASRVDIRRGAGAASAHPGPLHRGWAEFPKVVQNALDVVGIDGPAAKEPEIAPAIGPGRSVKAASGDVSGGRLTQCSIHAGRPAGSIFIAGPHGIASAHPGPLVRGWVELPKIIELAIVAVDIEALAPEEPEITAAVGPALAAESASGHVCGGRRSQCAINSGPATRSALTITADGVASAHPRPFVRGWIELPKVVELAAVTA